jgi:hypothetical protein
LDGLGDMLGQDFFRAGQIGNGARDFQNAIVGAGAEVQVVHGILEKLFGFVFEGTEFFQLLWTQASVAGDFGFMGETFLLPLPGSDDAFANLGGGFTSAIAANLAEFDLGHFYVQINPVQKRVVGYFEISLAPA